MLPLTCVVLAVLFVVTLSYREVVTVYTKAGGSYVVARENFGPTVAQVAAVALMLDYIVTVAVQSAAGTAAVISAIPALSAHYTARDHHRASSSCCSTATCAGIREAGRAFAFPTYFFVVSMAVVIVTGLVRELLGDLPHYDRPTPAPARSTSATGSAMLAFGAVYILLKAFANGGSSLTGLEAISNGVSAFKPPEGPNARRTLVDHERHPRHAGPRRLVAGPRDPRDAVPVGTPTVISQVAKAVSATGAGRPRGVPACVQLATMLIL